MGWIPRATKDIGTVRLHMHTTGVGRRRPKFEGDGGGGPRGGGQNGSQTPKRYRRNVHVATGAENGRVTGDTIYLNV